MIDFGFDSLRARFFIRPEPRRWPHAIALVALVVACLALAGCGGRAGLPTLVPTPVPCIRAERVPPEVPPTGQLPSDARQAADTLGAKVLELRGTDRILRGLISACISTN